MVAATVGYSFGQLLMADYALPWEDASLPYPANVARPVRVAVEASNGASDYGNKFGEPVLCGFARSFGLVVGQQRSEYVKVGARSRTSSTSSTAVFDREIRFSDQTRVGGDYGCVTVILFVCFVLPCWHGSQSCSAAVSARWMTVTPTRWRPRSACASSRSAARPTASASAAALPVRFVSECLGELMSTCFLTSQSGDGRRRCTCRAATTAAANSTLAPCSAATPKWSRR